MVSSTENGSFIYMQAGLLLAEKPLWMHTHYHQLDIIKKASHIYLHCVWFDGLLAEPYSCSLISQSKNRFKTLGWPIQLTYLWYSVVIIKHWCNELDTQLCWINSSVLFSAQIIRMPQEHSRQVTVIVFWESLLGDMILPPGQKQHKMWQMP